jgi:hypothetical protein
MKERRASLAGHPSKDFRPLLLLSPSFEGHRYSARQQAQAYDGSFVTLSYHVYKGLLLQLPTKVLNQCGMRTISQSRPSP